MMERLSVVVPTYNEAASLPRLLDELSATLAEVPHEVIVVDDDSPDGTWRVAEARSLVDPRVRSVRRMGERGLATAVLAGVREARGEYVAVMDADGQHPASALPRLLAAAEASNAAIAVGSRHVPGGSDAAFSGARRVVSHGAITAAHAFLPSIRKRSVRDPVSGLFLVRRAKLPDLSHLKPRGYKVLLELLVAMSDERVVEVPYRFERRGSGASKLGWGTFASFAAHLARLATHDPHNRRLAAFLAVGASGVLVNLLPVALGERALGVAGFWPLFALSAVARELAVLWNFAWNDRFTFRDRRWRDRWGVRLLRWHVVTAASTAAYFAIVSGLLLVGSPLVVATAVAIAAGVAINWTGADRWLYRVKPGPEAPAPK